MNVYLAIDNDDYFRRALIVAWQEACLRRRGGVVLAWTGLPGNTV